MADRSAQLDALVGCPELQVPSNHLARRVLEQISRLDFSAVEKGYSSLGRHGYRPIHVIGVLVYASLVGLHHSTEVARALKTDAALRLLSGGHEISHQTLRRFRMKNAAFMEHALRQTVALAKQDGLLKPDLAVDSVRLRANASKDSVRTLSRSNKRLAELAEVDRQKLCAEELALHDAKIKKHQSIVEQCKAMGRTSLVTTNPEAGWLKFPDGSAAPGHRVTVTAAGVKQRLVVSVLIDASTNDYRKLEPSLTQARQVLLEAGVPADSVLEATADAGYFSRDDLVFAEQTPWVDVLIASKKASNTSEERFAHDAFQRGAGGVLVCPAGNAMSGPTKDCTQPGEVWYGRGCRDCPLRSKCTDAEKRKVRIDPELERARAQMIERLDSEQGRVRYKKRIATVEPVFSNLESTMKYRRVSSRKAEPIRAEILLKLLAHNISRLAVARKLLRVLVLLGEF